jgi:uncharacterized protein involved in outer membrane biogenesis
VGRILATFATILILLLAAAFALPAFVDWNSYRSTIEEMASGVLGRKVSIRGDIGIELLPEPHLRANDVTASNGKADGVLMKASAVDVSLSLEALLSGRLDASQLKLVRPALSLDFSKSFAEADAAPAGVRNVDIEDGSISAISRHGRNSEALALTNINGTASASASGNAYHFAGRMSKDGRSFEVKAQATPQPSGVRLDGTAADPASKLSIHADGLLSARPDPVFEGALAVNMPQAQAARDANPLPFDLVAKSAARIGLSDAKLSDLELTLDPRNRSQILTGAANIAFGAGVATVALKALSLDADALLSGSAWPSAASAPGDWDRLGAAADGLLWLYPGVTVSLGLEAGQVQLRGELIETVKLHGKRTAGRWVFDEALATLPGESTLKLAGTLSKADQQSRLTASLGVEGKSLGRLARWLIPSAVAGGRLPLGAYNIKGSLTLSPEVSAFEGVTGRLDGTPFTAGLHVGKAPVRSLQASLAGDHFDLSTFEGAGNEAMLSADGLKNAWQAGLARLAALLGGESGEGFETADIDISAGGIKTASADAKNVAVHVKYSGGLVTVSRLSAETMNGLVLKAEGLVPLGGEARGRFGGRIEARSPEAVVQAAALAGFDTAVVERRAADMAPAALTVSYSAGAPGSATARLDGNLGQARVEASAQLKGSLSDWNDTELSAQLKLSEPDGNKLAQLFFPKAALPAGAAPTPGALSINLGGVPKRLQTQASLSAGVLQGQLDGVAALKPLSFQGKASVSSQAPEQFLPGPVLALLGGEPRAALRLGAAITADASRIEARDLAAESPGNLVAGRLALGSGSVTRIDADLKSDKVSLPSLLSHFLSGTPQDGFAAVLPASLTVAPPPQDIWSGRPFALSTFKETEGTISLAAKTMKLGDTLALSGAAVRATLGKGRLDIESLSGKTLGGTLDASLSLAAQDSAIAAQAALTLSGIDLSTLAASGTAPLITGPASFSLKASGQGMSPRGLISVLRGRGAIRLGGGHLSKLTPYAVQARADELLTHSLPLTEDAVTKTVAQAVQSNDFKFRKLAIPVTVADGVLEMRRASFRDGEATVRMEGYIDLNKALVDSTWQMGVSSDRRQKWPPVKLTLAGPLRELGAKPRTPAAEDFVRAILIRKMEGDITKLEGLNKPGGASPKPVVAAPTPAPARAPAATPAPARASTAWSTAQQPAPAPKPRKKKEDAAAKPPEPEPTPSRSFEQRMRDALDGIGATSSR